MSKITMPTFAASEAKNNFGRLIDAAQRSPVAIKRRGRSVAFVISPSDMETIEDLWLGMQAHKAMRRGKFLSAEETKKYMDGVLKHHARR